jgi:hypothetical protein
MARELYIPVNGFSKKTSKFYAPVNGFSKEIVKAYCSVNGFSKLFYEKGGGGGNTGFWFYYETTAKQIMYAQLHNKTYTKDNIGIAYFAMLMNGYSGHYSYSPILISTDPNAVSYSTSSGQTYNYQGTVLINDDTWYWSGKDITAVSDNYVDRIGLSPDCWLDGTPLAKTYDYYQGWTEACNDFLKYIYADDFAEDYILETPYNLRKGDKEKTIRKALAIWLYKNFAQKNNASYIALLTNIDTIVSTMLSNVSNYDVIDIVIYQNYNVIRIEYSYSNASSDNKSLMSKNTEFGYTWYQLRSSMSESGGKYVQIDTSGNIIYRNNYGTYTQYVGANISLYYDNAYRVILTNIGLNL